MMMVIMRTRNDNFVEALDLMFGLPAHFEENLLLNLGRAHEEDLKKRFNVYYFSLLTVISLIIIEPWV